ncbi:hypothetical protein FMEXI_13826 [Fusarium mexicanum]|uniref:Uncharacterized protein n=1 Tax=Fusarium mexicanum TaxID=751941 RepID=A0A8H5I5N8_9HYPO|nr:hypothetical protein FMEXI_13826 [Fusarium mexicanum]
MVSLYQLNGSLQPFAKLLFLPAAVLISVWVVTTTAKRWMRHRRQHLQATKAGIVPPEKVPVIEPLHDFDWKTAPRHTPSELITIDEDYLDRVTHRRSIIATHGSTVHGCTPEGDAAVRELYTYLLSEQLPKRFPTIFKLSKDNSMCENLATGMSFPTLPEGNMDAALRVLGETVEEDLFLLQETPEGHRSVAFMCCFPAGFDPSSKLGKTLVEIHAPVPSYEKIGSSMEKFFTKLEVGKSVKRTNWSVQTHTELFNCQGNHITGDDKYETDEDVDIEKTFLRIELQTLTRLPKTRAILFSFKTYLYPVRQIKDEGLGPAFADAIEGLAKGNAPGMWTYKSAVDDLDGTLTADTIE